MRKATLALTAAVASAFLLAGSASFGQSVQVALDDPSFANAVPARLNGTSWSVAVATPAVGQHTVYARASQGYDTGAVTSQTFTVTK